MALPASQYSVLDARKIERLSDDMFRCYVGKLNFGAFSVEPVLTLEGSEFVNEINNKFTASMANVVRWREGSSPLQKDFTSDTTIEVNLQIPGWCSFIPVSTIERSGSSVMQATLNAMVPRFLQQLQKDYDQWASGDDKRKPVSDGGL